MDIVNARCAGLDVHKATVVAAVRVPGGPSGERRGETKKNSKDRDSCDQGYEIRPSHYLVDRPLAAVTAGCEPVARESVVI